MKLKHLLENNKKLPGYGQDVYDGDINWSSKKLTSLEGAPNEVKGNFRCNHNQLTSLRRAPKKVGGCFSCTNNQLASLNGAPEKVGGDFICYNTHLKSLVGAPEEVGGVFYCSLNQLTSLVGAPEEVGGGFYCSLNKLTSLEGVHKQIKRIGGVFVADNNPIESHVLGLLLIDGITEIELDNKEVETILNKHLKNPNKRQRAAHAQRELIDADLDDYAEL